MKNIVKLILFLLLSMFINIIEVLCFGLLFVELIDRLINSFNLDMQNFLLFSYIAFVFFFNVGVTYFLILKKGISRLFYIHIPISLFAIVPLIFFIGGFFR